MLCIDTLPVLILGYLFDKGVFLDTRQEVSFEYNVPNNVDRLLKKRHPNDRLNKTPFCRQGGG